MSTVTYPAQNVVEPFSLDPDTLARGYLLALQRGEQPQRPPVEQLGRWARLCDILDMVKGDGEGVQRALRTLIATQKFPGLAGLLDQDHPQLRIVSTDSECPPLPEQVKANEARAQEASPTLDAMISFFRYWATRSYEGYHEAVAIWVLSTIAARRVHLRWRGGVWTPFYIMLVSPSTTHAKTEAAAYGQKVIQASGLNYLLSPDELTPQKLLLNMSGRIIPRNYSCMDAAQQKELRKKIAFSGQRGWLYDEFGNKLQEIIKARGYNAVFYSLLKQLYDCKETFEYDTILHGNAPINMPYLAIIGTATPACLQPIAGRDGAVWTDGFFARLSFVVPPKDEIKLKSAPNEEAIVPEKLTSALRNWHKRLGEPECEIIDVAEREEQLNEAFGKDKGKKKDLPDYEIKQGDLPQTNVLFSNEVYQAYDEYFQALAILAQNNGLDERYRSTYGRLPEKALRIAMLLASLLKTLLSPPLNLLGWR